MSTIFKQIENTYYILEINLENYIYLNQIGKGGYGDVYLIQNKKSKAYYAAKILNKPSQYTDQSQYIKNLKREIDLLNKINHPCILRYHGYCSHGFKNSQFPMLITEYKSNGSLYDLLELQRKGKALSFFNNTAKYIITYGIAKGMEFLHDNNVIHRDLKPQNILLNEYFLPTIGDFGLAKIIDPENPDRQSTMAGTFIYQAPEILKGKEYNMKVDIYAFGIVLYEIVTGQRPYHNYLNNPPRLLFRLSSERLRPKIPNEMKNKVPFEIEDLMERCWDDEPENRPTFSEIAKILLNKELIEKMGADYQQVTIFDNMLSMSPNNFDANSVISFIPYTYINKKRSRTFDEIYSINDCTILDEKCQQMIDEAKNGNNEKLYMVGKNYMEGTGGFPKNIVFGMQYLQYAQKTGNIEAALLLADIYYKEKNYIQSIESLNNNGVMTKSRGLLLMAKNKMKMQTKDKASIKNLLKDASALSNKEAMVLYGKLCMEGTEIRNFDDINYSESFKYFELAAQEGDAEGLAYCGLFYYYGYGVIEFNFEKAAELFQESYEKGSMTGAAFLSECYAKGRGVTKDEKRAVELARESKRHGNNTGKNKYGIYLNQGLGDLEIDKKESCRLWKETALEGDAEGSFLYANCLVEGGDYNVERNIEEAIKYYKESISGGNLTAMASFGHMLIQGQFNDEVFDDEFIESNDCIDDGLELIEFAANHGDDFAIIIFSHLLVNGIGIEPDIDKAIKYLEVGKERNIVDCLRMYGNLINQGKIQPIIKEEGNNDIRIADDLEGRKPDEENINNQTSCGIF
ncbi:hypothetical protein M9Y10_029691 [Tritrichomonas musculus]|uniref:Protein kinase domain-containing protein n=1 Tax=Tritrichomonas musculus TaxID=1915356 RepID=A0ABR2KMT4_9EUKA